MMNTSDEIRISILLVVRGTRTGGLTEFFPAAHVGNTFFEPRHHHFHALGDSFAVLASYGGGPARSSLRKNHFSGAALVHRAADMAQRADHVVVCRVELLLISQQYLDQEPEDG